MLYGFQYEFKGNIQKVMYVLAKNKKHVRHILKGTGFRISDIWQCPDATLIELCVNNSDVYCNLRNPKQDYAAFLPIRSVINQTQAKETGWSNCADYLVS